MTGLDGGSAGRDGASRVAPLLMHVFATFAIGGAEIRFATMANRLGNRYRHIVVSLDGRFDCADRLDPSLGVQFLPILAEKGGGVSIANLIRFRRVLRTCRPDILATYSWGAAEWALANRLGPRLPNLHFEDGFGPEEADGRQIRRRVWFRRLALTGTTLVIVPSLTLRTIALDVWRLASRRVLYIPNGIDSARFAKALPEAVGASDPRRSGACLIGILGTLRREKNVGRLFRVLARLPETCPARLVVAGDGPERPALEAEVRSLGLGDRVVFAGQTKAPEHFLSQLDIFALSSDSEQMPLTILEAMAAGLPVVATDVGDIRHMVSIENRPMIVPLDREDLFAGQLAALIRDPDLRHRLGMANQKRVASAFDLDAMLATYDDLFGRVMTNGVAEQN